MAMGISAIEGYAQSDTDEANTSPQYYGFLNNQGAYYISQAVTTTGVMAFRYYSGSGLANYVTDWGNRAALTYDYYSNIFTNT